MNDLDSTITIRFRSQREVDVFTYSMQTQLIARGFSYLDMNPKAVEIDDGRGYIIFRNLIYKTKRLEKGITKHVIRLTDAEIELVAELLLSQIEIETEDSKSYNFQKNGKPAFYKALSNMHQRLQKHCVVV